MDDLIAWLRRQLDAEEALLRSWPDAYRSADLELRRALIARLEALGMYVTGRRTADPHLQEWVLGTLCLLAYPYRMRPGYRIEWQHSP